MSSGIYTQNFNSLAASGTLNPWTNNLTLAGWYASSTSVPGVVTNYRAADGADNAGSIYSFGSTASSERALGSIASGGVAAGTFAYGVRLTNNTGLVQTNFLISFAGEQWRNGGSNLTNTLSFSYATQNGAITNADANNSNAWTAVTALDFQSPIVGTSAAALDGNLAANRRSFTNIPLPGLVVSTNQELFLRWRDVDDPGADQGLAIDDLKLSFTAVNTGPPNDAFAQASPLAGTSNRIAASNIGATREPGEPDHGRILSFSPRGRASLWWTYSATTNGVVELDSRGSFFQPILAVYQGDNLSNLTAIGHNFVWAGGSSGETRLLTRIQFDAKAGQAYHIAVDGADPGTFNLLVLFTPAAPNDNFDSRAIIVSPVTTVFGTTAGATLESGEPLSGDHSVWWSWTPLESGSVILTTFGSTFDTILDIYTGSSLHTLASVGNNDDGFVFPDDGGGVNAPAFSGSFQDESSRLRFDAAAGQAYQIAVDGGSGNFPLNFTTLAIEDIVSLQRTVQANGSMSFSAVLKISNLRPRTTGALRVRLVARPSYRVSSLFRNDLDFLESLNTPEQALGTFTLTSPTNIVGSNSLQRTVTGLCPAKTSNGNVSTNWSAFAILEEMAGGLWNVRDTRLIAPQYYSTLDGLTGGGVVTLGGGGASPFAYGYFRIVIEPAGALATNGGWRILQLTDTAYYHDNAATYGLPAATFYTLNFLPAFGFITPSNRSLSVVANQTNTIVVTYTNLAPQALPPGLSNGAAQLTFSAPAGQRYAIERSTNLAAWVTLTTNTVGANGVLRVNDSNLTNNLPRGFYRARFTP